MVHWLELGNYMLKEQTVHFVKSVDNVKKSVFTENTRNFIRCLHPRFAKSTNNFLIGKWISNLKGSAVRTSGVVTLTSLLVA